MRCNGFAASPRFETCKATLTKDGRNLDGTPHTCKLVLTAYAKKHPVKGGLSDPTRA